MTTCPNGYWADAVTNTCQSCNSSCAACTGPTNCTKCASSNAFIYNQICYDTFCPEGTYRNVISMTCNLCPTGCRLCGSPSLCLQCESGFSSYTDPLTQDSSCVKTCPSSYFSGFVSSSNSYVCQKCDSSCAECSGPNSNQCTDCLDNKVLSEGSCISPSVDFSCPNGTYLDSFQCLNCSKGCASCSEVARCNECLPGYVLGETTGLCEIPRSACHPSCGTCSGTTEYDCTSCASPLMLQAGKCVINCGLGFKYNVMNNKCEICFEDCTSCVGELFYFGGNCVFSCPAGSIAVVDEKGQISCNLEEGAPILSFVQQPSQSTAVGLNQDIIIQVSIAYPSSSEDQTKVIIWKQTDINAPTTKLLQGITALNSPVLIIPKNNLRSNTKYGLTVEVLLDGAAATSASTSFTTAKSIISGDFIISPSTGSFHDTTFTLTLTGWTNVTNEVLPTFSILASRNDNPKAKIVIALSLDMLNSSSLYFGGYNFTIPSLYEGEDEKDVVYRIELEASSSSDSLSLSKTIILQPLSSDKVSQLIADIDPAAITESEAMSNFIVLTTQNFIQSNVLETQTTNAMLAAFQVYQTLTGDNSITCVDTIHCSGHGTCITTTGTNSSTNPMCKCDPGWGGIACNKDAQQLQQAQNQLGVLLTKLLGTAPTPSTMNSQLLVVQMATRDPDLITNGGSMLRLMSQTVISSYRIIDSSSSAPSSSRSALSMIADAAFSLISLLSNGLETGANLDQLLQIFAGSLEDILAGLSLGEYNEIDTSSLYALLMAVDDLFEEIKENNGQSGENRRILQDQQLPQQVPRQPQRILSSSSTSSASSTSDDKNQAALQNKVATQTPFQSKPKIDISTLKQVLSNLLSTLKQGKTVKMKTKAKYDTVEGGFELPQLTLKITSSVKFMIQETKSGKNNHASNSNSLVTKSVTFSATDGSNKVPINNLPTPIKMTIPKITPTTPSSIALYQCSYYDETSRRFLTNGCSFIGENLTHIFCQCNHATEFAAQINKEVLNAYDSFFNKPSLQELLELSALKIQTSSIRQKSSFKIELQKNILSKTHTAVREYTLKKIDLLPVIVSLLILLILYTLYPIIDFFLTIKQSYFASWSNEIANVKNGHKDQKKKSKLISAKAFWSFYSLFTSRTQKYFSDYSVRMLTFYTEVLNLMGNVLVWAIFVNSQKGQNLFQTDQSPIPQYVFVIGLSFMTATVSFYATLGSINLCRMHKLRKHYVKIEMKQLTSIKKLGCWELFYMTVCVLIILAWLALFAVLSTILLDSEIYYWLRCCLGATIYSYVVVDTVMVAVYYSLRLKHMPLLLTLRALNSKYLSLSTHSKISLKVKV